MKLKYIFLISILLCSALVVTSTPADVYRPIQPSDNSLSGLVSATGDVTKMDYWFEDDKLYVDSEIHNTMSFRLNENMIERRLKGWNGHTVRVSHRTDEGVIDTSEIVNVGSDGVWVYFYDIDFSTVIVDGYAGTYTKIETTVYNNMTNFSYGQSLTNMSSITVNVTQGYGSALSKYDLIADMNPVLWLKADGNANDSSVYGNNGTFNDDANASVDGKYGNAFGFDGVGDYIDVGNDGSLQIVDNLNINCWIQTTQNGDIIKKYNNVGDQRSWAIYIQSGTVRIIASPYGNATGLTIEIGTTNVLDGGRYNLNAGYNGTHLYIYINGVLDSTPTPYSNGLYNSTDNVTIGRSFLSAYYKGSMDNMLVFNYTLNATAQHNLYYDKVQELQFRTNSNSTWSDNWNSISDNPLSVPFGSGETLTHLQFMIPTEAVIDGVTTRDYNTTAGFAKSSTVGFTEPTIVISEAATSNYYKLNISHQAGLNSSGYINYTTTNTDLLAAEWNSTAVLYSDNQNATLIYTEPTFYISTGVLNSGDEWQYNVTVPYGDMPSYDIVFTDYNASNTDRIVNITLSNYTFGITKVKFNFSVNEEGVTYIWRYNNDTEIMRLTSSETNSTMKFTPDYLVPEGDSYLRGGPRPTFLSWLNDKTASAILYITVVIDEAVNFSAVADQTITTWNWFKDGVDQLTNFDNITLSWSSAGNQTVQVNVTNDNGTSETLQWNVTVIGAPDTKFEYWDGASWTEGEALEYLYFDCFWWTRGYDDGVFPNAEQSAGQATLKITNNGSSSGIPQMYLNTTPPSTVRIFVDNDSTFDANSIELTNISQAVHSSLSNDTNVTLWAWINLTGADNWDFEIYANVTDV